MTRSRPERRPSTGSAKEQGLYPSSTISSPFRHRLSKAGARIAAKYPPKFRPLFEVGRAREKLVTSDSVARASEGFTVADAGLLADIATSRELDALRGREFDDTGPHATLHALHALIRIGPEAADAAAEKLAKKALQMEHNFSFEIGDVDKPTLVAALAAMGPAALKPLLAMLVIFPSIPDVQTRNDRWFGLSVVCDAISYVAFESCDPAVAERAAVALCGCLRAMLPLALRGNGQYEVLDTLSPLLSDLLFVQKTRAEAVKLLRQAYETVYHRYRLTLPQRWPEVLWNAGLEAVPGDPLVEKEDAPLVAAMWEKRHPGQPGKGPFPGQAGYEVPPASEWKAPLRCCNSNCKKDKAAQLAAVRQLDLAGSSSGPLLVCGGCRTTAYCSPACQRACWNRIHKETGRTSHFGVKIEEALERLDEEDFLKFGAHRLHCRMRKKALDLAGDG
ncbi:hypothetical protein DFJ74DRAFT_122166 [Hyaloraphidium curvatum]|nr:hypothetical protein DFJ74DRAFT_122166 [Hyaloraphidium curvatum]